MRRRPAAAVRVTLVMAGLLGALVLTGPGPSWAAPAPDPRVPAGAEPTAPPDQEPLCGANQASQWIPRDPAPLGRLGAAQAQALPGPRSPVTVAVVDAGVTPGNPHLEDALLPPISLVQDEPGDTPEQRRAREEHGTQIAAIIAARDLRPAQPSALVGVAPRALIQPVVFYVTADSEVPGNRLTPDTLAAGIRSAAASGAKVINVSFSQSEPSGALESAVADAVAGGALVVASAGNGRTDGARFPATYPGVLSVAAVDGADVAPVDAPQGATIDLAAPGADIIGVSPSRDCRLKGAGDPPDSSYAAAYVSGAAALVWSAMPEASAAEVEYRLTASADRPQRGSRNDSTGWGVVQPYAAMTMTVDPARPGPLVPGQPAAGVVEVAAEPFLVQPGTDPLADSRRAVVRWGLVGLAGLGLLLLLTRWNRLPRPR